MAFQTIELDIRERIATLRLNRPASGNAIDHLMAAEVAEACEHIAQNDDVWAVIIAGAGDTFCAGTDADAVREAFDAPELLNLLRVAEKVAAIEKPVVAAIDGDAIDQGFELALACDIRVASEGARFGLTHVERGLIPWDGGTQRLPRLAGRATALEMILTSRVLTAAEAFDLGVVNEVVDSGEEKVLLRARELAETVVSHGPIAAGYLKEAVLKGMDMTLDQGLRLEADLNVILQSTSDRAEGIRSFLERRDPKYAGQ